MSTVSRRALLGSATAAGLAVAAPSAAFAGHRRLRVVFATNEPWGTYHVGPLLPALRDRGLLAAQVVPDRTKIAAGDPVPVVTLREVRRADLLVVNGATDWPTEVVTALPRPPVIASSLAYLRPQEVPGAAVIRPRLVAATAASEREADAFAAHLGIRARRVRIVGNAQLDEAPAYRPVPGTVLVVTSVSKSSVTGGAAPGAQLLLDVAAALEARGMTVRVGLHPREDRALWSRYDIAEEGSLAASATAASVVGIPGSVFPLIAGVGAPLVGVVAPGLDVPDYLLDVCAPAQTVDEAVAAVEARRRPDADVLDEIVGPVGGAGRRLARLYRRAAR